MLAPAAALAGCFDGALHNELAAQDAPAAAANGVQQAGDDYLPQERGWKLAWSDEFNGDALDRDKWAPEESCWGGGNNERQCYTDRPENVEVANGALHLKARRETFTGPLYPSELARSDQAVRTQSFTSGKVSTHGLADWRYGRFSARIKLPLGQGLWPAFWMMPSEGYYGSWPLSGEVDIMESINLGAGCDECEGGIGENRTVGALHFGDLPPNNTWLAAKSRLPGGVSPADDYHVYSVEWGEGLIQWFVDDKLFFRVDANEWRTASPLAKGDATAPFNRKFYLLLNLAVGGNWPEGENEKGLDDQSVPGEALVDWVRVYQCAPDMKTGRKCME